MTVLHFTLAINQKNYCIVPWNKHVQKWHNSTRNHGPCFAVLVRVHVVELGILFMTLFWRSRSGGIRYEAPIKLFSLYCQWTPPRGYPKSRAVIPFSAAGCESGLITHNCVPVLRPLRKVNPWYRGFPQKASVSWDDPILDQEFAVSNSAVFFKTITYRLVLVCISGYLKSCEDHMYWRQAVKQVTSCS